MNKPIKAIKITIISLVVLVIVGYSYYQTRGYLQGPVLQVNEPLNNSTHHQEKISIQGYAKNISYISLDGRQIFTNPAGFFSEDILLSKGYNIVDVSAKDKYERERQIVLKLVYLD